MSTKPEALIFADDRPTSLDDNLYQWSIDAEDHIRRLQAENDRLRAATLRSADFISSAPVSSGVCCGASMEGHESGMYCGHAAVDQWDWAKESMVAELRSLATPKT